MQQYTHISKDGDRTITYSDPGSYMVFLENVSGRYVFELRAEGIELHIYGAYAGTGTKQHRLETVQHHQSPHSSSNLLIKGVFDGSSRFTYHGLIRIEKDCDGSSAYQKNHNLILSDSARVTSQPDLEILSNDVKCTHGSATGGPNKEHLNYLHSRGIARSDAISLIKEGFLEEVYSNNQSPTSNIQ